MIFVQIHRRNGLIQGVMPEVDSNTKSVANKVTHVNSRHFAVKFMHEYICAFRGVYWQQ